MTQREDASALSTLAAMLAEGLQPSVRDQEWDCFESDDGQFTLQWQGRNAQVASLVAPLGEAAGAASKSIAKVVTDIRPKPHLVDAARERLRYHGPAALAQLVGNGLRWPQTVRLAEALAQMTEEDARSGDPRAMSNVPLVRRARFLTLSTPWRFGDPETAQDNPFGDDGSELTERARDAREHWLVDLVNHEEHRALTARSDQLDREVRRLLFTGPDGLGSPLSLETDATSRDDHTELATWISREWFLPRFMLVDCWRTLRHGKRLDQVVAVSPYAPLALLTAAVAAGFVAPVSKWILVQGAIALSLIAFGIIVVAIGLRRELGYLACPRLPASAAVGLLAILTLDSRWAATPGGRWRWAAVLLVVASYGYLVVEAASHGASKRAWLRALIVACLGFMHSVAVAVLFLQVVAPALNVALGRAIKLLSAPALSRLYLLAGATGLAAGVFLQVLWDDRPVTYPLTHLKWRGRGRP